MKYWVFDLDGTLTDSFTLYFQIMEDLLGTQLSSAKKREYIGVHPSKVLNENLGEQAAARALQILQERSENEAGTISAFQGIPPALQFLKANNCKMSVWTARDLESTTVLLKTLKLDPYFDHIISGNCVSERKPHPEGLLKIKELYGCTENEMVMVGDHAHDMEAAKAASVFAVRASWHKHWDDGECALSDRQFQSGHDFLKWVGSTQSGETSLKGI